MANKELTLNDLVYQMENFEYSQEYYQLMTEEAEINIMEQFLASVAYAKENADTAVLMESGFFMEADENTDAKTAAVSQKLIGKKNMFISRVKSIIDRIVRFFQKIAKSLKAQIDKLTTRVKSIKIVPELTEEQKDAIDRAINEAAEEAGFPLSKHMYRVTGLRNNNKHFASRVLDDVINGTVTVTISQDNFANAMSAKQLKKAVGMFKIAKAMFSGAVRKPDAMRKRFQKMHESLNATHVANLRDGLTMSFKDVSDIESIAVTLQSFIETINNGLNNDDSVPDKEEIINLNTALLNEVLKISADTSKLYAAHSKYATIVTKKIEEILKSAPEKKDEKKVVDQGGTQAKKVN